MTDEEIDAIYEKLKAKHGTLVMLVDGGTVFAFKSPPLEVFEDWQEAAVQQNKRFGAMNRELCNRTLVQDGPPLGDMTQLARYFERHPAKPKELADELFELAKGSARIIVKKG